ncbi:MAG TPA: ATP-binding protein [Vicinamibacterales bacterium]|nr:ATP-binding protein [Vicinamibacterales bacterium]
MPAIDIIDRLKAHRTLGAVPDDELAWLAAHGSLRELGTGDVLSAAGSPVSGLFILLDGRIAIFVDRGAGRHKIMEWLAGDVTGLLPYSRLVTPPGDTVAEEPTTILAVDREHLPAMIRECQEATSVLVHTMLDRARVFTSSALHDEKLVSLGKLSAGLAHELNNPASAIERSAVLLDERLDEVERATQEFSRFRLDEAQLAAVDATRRSCVVDGRPGVRSPIEQAEREEALAEWLTAHGLDAGTAEALADTQVTFEALDRVAGAVAPPELDAVLRWVAANASARSLTSEIQQAALRISGLVVAIKGFTHMDQAMVAEPVDLGQGLRTTVTILRSKARKKSVSVIVDVEPGLPPVRGFVGELNQIWANLIDNALDAIADAGRVEVRARREGARVAVRILDNGSGIPAGVIERIFDPFFTTKPVGAGTGLGLDIVRRLVRHNDGEISVESRPGRTEFRVSLPTVAPRAGGATG